VQAARRQVNLLDWLFLDRSSDKGAWTGIASQLCGGVNSLIDCVGKSDRSSRHLVPLPLKGMAEALRDNISAEADVRRVADACAKMADGLSANDSQSYKPRTTNSSDFMFH
jgi:hypothetical protein